MKHARAVRTAAACWALLAGLCAPLPSAATDSHLVYPLTTFSIDSRYDYDWTVLRTALEKSSARFGSFEMRPASASMSPQRISQELAQPAGRINIFVRATDAELERVFLPIRIPVDKGLLGYRVFLVRHEDLPRFAAVRGVKDLRGLRAGLGKDWADVAILRAAGIEVVEGSTYDGLFSMLEAKRFDFFSRAADEAGREFAERGASQPQLALEPTLLLHYPLPRYFFVRRDAEGELLAKRIEAGLETMIRDGSLDALFQRYKGKIIERGGLRRRRLIELRNPSLSPQTPLGRAELWYNPLTDK